MTLVMIALTAVLLPVLAWVLMRVCGRHWWVAAIALTPLYLLVGWYAHGRAQALHAVYETTRYRTADDIVALANRMDMWDAVATAMFMLSAVCAGVIAALLGRWAWRRVRHAPEPKPLSEAQIAERAHERVMGERFRGMAYGLAAAERLAHPAHRRDAGLGPLGAELADAIGRIGSGDGWRPASATPVQALALAFGPDPVEAITNDPLGRLMVNAERMLIERRTDVDTLSRWADVDDLEVTPRESIVFDGSPEGQRAAILWCLVNSGDTRECVDAALSFHDPLVAAYAGALAGTAYGVEDSPYARRLPEAVRRPIREAVDGAVRAFDDRGAWWPEPEPAGEPDGADAGGEA